MAVFHTFAITNSSTATTTFTITIPNDIAIGEDLYILAVSRDHTVGTAKYTCVDNDTGGNSWSEKIISSDRKTTLFWKKATSGTAGKTVTLAGGVGSFTGGLAAFLGGFEGDPTNDLTMEENASGNETHAGFTPTYPGSFIVFGVTDDTNDNDVSSPTSANLGALAELFAAESTGGADCKSTMAGVDNPSGVATGNFTWSQTNGTTDSIVFSIRSGVFDWDTVTVSENLDLIIENTRRLSVFDTVTVSEQYSPGTLGFLRFDSITVSESRSFSFIWMVSVFDSVSITEYPDFLKLLEASDIVTITESVTLRTAPVVFVYEEIDVLTHCLPNTMEIFIYDTVQPVEVFKKSIQIGQMPLSRPQGSIQYDYDDGGSTPLITGLRIGGGL